MQEEPIIIKYKTTCDKCKEYGYFFCSPSGEYSPKDYLKGCQRPEILIIAINPRGEIGTPHEKSRDDLIKFNPLTEHKGAQRFYSKYRGISQNLFDNWCGIESIVAETDLYKCFSRKVDNSIKNKLIDNCFPWLNEQLIKLSDNLKIIICNGVPVSEKIKEKFPKCLDNLTRPYSDFKSFSYCHLKITQQSGLSELNVTIIFIPFLSGRFPLKKEKVGKIKNVIENDILKQKYPELAAKLNL